MVKQMEVLRKQSLDLQGVLELAQDAATGLDGFDGIVEFRNLWLETEQLAQDMEGLFNDSSGGSFSIEWDEMFGTLDSWFDNSEEIFRQIEVSDKTNTWSYSIADSYQQLYVQNAESAEKFRTNAKLVNEKGALKQIAEELAHLIQLENNNMNLLAQMLKEQAVENAQNNDARRQELIQVKREGEGIRRFMNVVDKDDLSI